MYLLQETPTEPWSHCRAELQLGRNQKDVHLGKPFTPTCRALLITQNLRCLLVTPSFSSATSLFAPDFLFALPRFPPGPSPAALASMSPDASLLPPRPAFWLFLSALHFCLAGGFEGDGAAVRSESWDAEEQRRWVRSRSFSNSWSRSLTPTNLSGEARATFDVRQKEGFCDPIQTFPPMELDFPRSVSGLIHKWECIGRNCSIMLNSIMLFMGHLEKQM